MLNHYTKLQRNRHNLWLQEENKRKKKPVTTLIRNAKLSYYSEQFSNCQGKTNSAWKLLPKIIPNKKCNTKEDSFDNMKEKVEEFNTYFANMGNTVLTIKELNNTNSAGSDKTQLKFIKDTLYIIASNLAYIINTLIVTGEFPSLWKHAFVFPIFISCDKDNSRNYRPISLLFTLSEVLEKIIARQLMLNLETRNLSNCQHGFRPRLSTETALTVITDEIYHSMDNRKISLVTLCYLSKAFDSVNHSILINKCLKLKIDSFWFSSYIRDRIQSVRIKKHHIK